MKSLQKEQGYEHNPGDIISIGHEDISLIRRTSTEELLERCRIRRIFDIMDSDNDGYLTNCDLKKLIKNRHRFCNGLPKGMSRYIKELNMANGDDLLDFEEFYALSQNYNCAFNEFVEDYSRANYFQLPLLYDPEVEDKRVYANAIELWPPPLTMLIFSAIQIATFVYDYSSNNKSPTEPEFCINEPAATLFIYNPHRRLEAWRFITYMMIHYSQLHIVMNLIIQIFLGIALELVHRWWRVALVYIAGVAAGSMVTSLTSPYLCLAGASGGVSALITAHLANIILNYREMSSVYVVLLSVVIYVCTPIGILLYYYCNGDNMNIGYMANIGGAIAGFLVGISILRNLRPICYEGYVRKAAASIYVILNCVCIIIHIFFHIFIPKYFPLQQTSAGVI